MLHLLARKLDIRMHGDLFLEFNILDTELCVSETYCAVYPIVDVSVILMHCKYSSIHC